MSLLPLIALNSPLLIILNTRRRRRKNIAKYASEMNTLVKCEPFLHAPVKHGDEAKKRPEVRHTYAHVHQVSSVHSYVCYHHSSSICDGPRPLPIPGPCTVYFG